MSHLRMAVMHLPTNFCANSSMQFGVIDIFRNPRWRPRVPNLVQISVIVTEIDTHMLQTLIRWRHVNYLPVSTFGHVVISASPWCIFLYNLMQDLFIQSKVIDIFPKFKMAAAAILDIQFMWIWPFRRAGSVVFVFCTKFGSNICYSHWNRRTFASDLHLMTSRELTSGFDFWSRSHLRVAVMQLSI